MYRYRVVCGKSMDSVRSTVVPGLIYIPDFLSEQEEDDLLSTVDSQTWNTSLKRRTQHYGRRYDYTSSKLVDAVEPLPDFLSSLTDRIYRLEVFESAPAQCIVNEYMPGQGISAHVDSIKQFGPVIASVSLGSDAVMQFTQNDCSVDVLLQRRSVVLLTEDARTVWKHAIPARKSDRCDGVVIKRDRRVSLTFRTLL